MHTYLFFYAVALGVLLIPFNMAAQTLQVTTNNTGVTCQDQQYTYNANVSGATCSNPSYAWSVVGGRIVSGLGTSSVSVLWNQAQPGQNVSLSVSVAGCSPSVSGGSYSTTLYAPISGVGINGNGVILCGDTSPRTYTAGMGFSGDENDVISYSWSLTLGLFLLVGQVQRLENQ
jgi:hypothetical protein